MTERYHFNILEYPQLGYRLPGMLPLTTPKYVLYKKVREWLAENATEGKWQFYKRTGRLVFVIDDEAMAFKLGYL